MFAVIKTGGKQYKVAVGDLLKVEKLKGEEKQAVEFNEVLLVSNSSDVTVGSPTIEGAVVKAQIVEQTRARKVIAFKKRRRQNSKRTRGHRQHLTLVRVTDIVLAGAKAKANKASAKDSK